MSVSIHKDYKGWHQMTVSYQTQDGVIGMRIPQIKTDLVIKWREQRNAIMRELQKNRTERMAIPRVKTRPHRVYKRYEEKYQELCHEYERLKIEMIRIDQKYWKNRKREKVMNHEPVFKMLFCLWKNYDSVTKRGA